MSDRNSHQKTAEYYSSLSRFYYVLSYVSEHKHIQKGLPVAIVLAEEKNKNSALLI